MHVPTRLAADAPARKRRRLWLLALVLLLGAVAVGAYYLLRPDPLAHVKELRDELRGEAGRQMSTEERREKWQQLRREMEKLTPQQRNELFAERRKQMKEKLDRFFKLSQREQFAELDRDIQRMEQRRREGEAARAAGRGGPGGRGGAGGPGSSSGGSTGRGANGSTTAGQGSSGSSQPQGGDGTSGPPVSTPETRDQRRKMMIDSTTPEERAQMNLYVQMVRDRRQQLGLPATPPRFGPR